jgi:DNA-binding protein HU-beta
MGGIKMTKKEFVALFAERGNFESKAEAERKLDTFMTTVEEVLLNGDEVNFIGWGKFEVVARAERKGRNPKTGEEITIPAKKAVKFKAGKKLNDKMN